VLDVVDVGGIAILDRGDLSFGETGRDRRSSEL
jgi:hypothetical protein